MSEQPKKVICTCCSKQVNEDDVCGDGYCRDCHVSLSFEDCVSGTWVAKRNIEGFTSVGVKMGYSKAEARKGAIAKMKELYPKADI